MNAPIQIRRDDVVRDIRELAALSALPITEVVAQAVSDALNRAKARNSLQERTEAVDELLRQVRLLPIVGPALTDAELYDEDGLPK
jgi:hypothetical protein